MKPVDVFVLFVFIRRLVKPFRDWTAYKLGVIDEKGNFLIPAEKRTKEQNDSISYLDKLIINLKRLLAKLPGGATMLATYAAALYLLHEKMAITEETEVQEDLANAVMRYIPEAKRLMEEMASSNMSSGNVADKGGELMQAKKREKIKRALPKLIDESLAKPDMLKRMRDMHVDPMKMKFTVRDTQRAEVDLKTIFTDAGWTYMGKGVAGIVFSNPSKNYVVKIFNQDDKGYKLWLAFCMANQDNPFVPKIKGKPTPINRELAAVRIEKLQPNTSRDNAELVGALQFWYERGADYEEFPLADYSLRKPFLKVMAFLDNASEALDLHDQNIMMRGQQIVLVDPLNAMGDQSLERYETKYGKRSQAFLNSRFNPQQRVATRGMFQ